MKEKSETTREWALGPSYLKNPPNTASFDACIVAIDWKIEELQHKRGFLSRLKAEWEADKDKFDERERALLVNLIQMIALDLK